MEAPPSRVLLGHNSSRKERVQHRAVAPLLLHANREVNVEGGYLSFHAICMVVSDSTNPRAVHGSEVGYLRHDGETWRFSVGDGCVHEDSFNTFALLVSQNLEYSFHADSTNEQDFYWGLVMVHTSAQYRGCGETEVEQAHLAPWVSSGEWYQADQFELRVPIDDYLRLVSNEYRTALGELMGGQGQELENRSLNCGVVDIAAASSGASGTHHSVLVCPVSASTSHLDSSSSTSVGLLLQLLRAVTLRGKEAEIAIQLTIFRRGNAPHVAEFSEVMNAYRQDRPMSICVKKDRRGRVQCLLRLDSGPAAKFILLGVLLPSYDFRLRLRVDGSGGGVFCTDFLLTAFPKSNVTLYKNVDLAAEAASVVVLKSGGSSKRTPAAAGKATAAAAAPVMKSISDCEKAVSFDPEVGKLLGLAQAPAVQSAVPSSNKIQGNKATAVPAVKAEPIEQSMEMEFQGDFQDQFFNKSPREQYDAHVHVAPAPYGAHQTFQHGPPRVNSNAMMDDDYYATVEVPSHSLGAPFGGQSELAVNVAEFGGNRVSLDMFCGDNVRGMNNISPDQYMFRHHDNAGPSTGNSSMYMQGNSGGSDMHFTGRHSPHYPTLSLSEDEKYQALNGRRPLFHSPSNEDFMMD